MSIEHGVFHRMPARDSEPAPPRPRRSRTRIEDRLARRGGAVELLRVPAFLYGLVTAARNALYDRGLLRARRVDVPVVSVGNLTAGGTGKTPFVVHLARALLRRGRRPGVLSRGFGARVATAVPGGARHDEALVYVRALPDVPHVGDPDRVRGASELARRGLDVVLLDDGFQHRRLARDLDLVLVDATRPWGLAAPGAGAAEPVRAHLPRGLLRESPRGLARADAIVLTRTDQAGRERLEALRAELERRVPGKPVIETAHRVTAVTDDEGWLLSPEALVGRTVDLVSGIGHPAAFEASVRETGATVRSHRRFPDHWAYTEADLDGLGDVPVVTTTKDAEKLRSLGVTPWIVDVEIAVTAGGAVLEALLDSLPEGRARRERRAIHEGLHG